MRKLVAFILLTGLVGCQIEQRSFMVNGRDAEAYIQEGANQKDKGVILQDFETNTKGWFGCGELELEQENGSLKMDFTNDRFRCIGSYLEVNDLTELGVVHLRIRVYTEAQEDLTLRIRFEDANGIETNYDEEDLYVKVNFDFKDYYIDFREKLVSVNGSFDKEAVSKMKIYFNTKGSGLFTGTVWVDEIGLTGQIPENL